MRILIAGAGKMARNVGFFLLRRGMDVVWADRERDWLAALEKRIGKDLRRLDFIDGETTTGKASFFSADDGGLPECDCLIETIEEDAPAKRAIIKALRERIVEGGPLLTNSSSILPGELGKGVAGAHFFYPVDMTGFVEAIFDEATDGNERVQVLGFLRSLDLDVIEQGPANAFAANRLFLPVQNECFKAVMAGVAPNLVDRASVSEALPAGTLAMMDSIGLDTV
ncbi:MAG: hypothetical protein GXP54_02860, partial [Deltaproteobacteria bacterium]|nr:hypothetical protein [Deltaproteobacteria bacterium]